VVSKHTLALFHFARKKATICVPPYFYNPLTLSLAYFVVSILRREELSFSRYSKINATSLTKTLRMPCFSLIRSIVLPSVKMSDKLFKDLWAACPRLEALDISGVKGTFTGNPDRVQSLVEHCPDRAQVRKLTLPWGVACFAPYTVAFTGLEEINLEAFG